MEVIETSLKIIGILALLLEPAAKYAAAMKKFLLVSAGLTVGSLGLGPMAYGMDPPLPQCWELRVTLASTALAKLPAKKAPVIWVHTAVGGKELPPAMHPLSNDDSEVTVTMHCEEIGAQAAVELRTEIEAMEAKDGKPEMTPIAGIKCDVVKATGGELKKGAVKTTCG